MISTGNCQPASQSLSDSVMVISEVVGNKENGDDDVSCPPEKGKTSFCFTCFCSFETLSKQQIFNVL